jgi:hypothetical protein
MSAPSTLALRPSTVAAAARQESDGVKLPLKLKYTEKVKRALKAHAASKGLTIADYFLQLAKADGLQLDGEPR